MFEAYGYFFLEHVADHVEIAIGVYIFLSLDI